MKNIYLLPTKKPSRLFKFANELHLDATPKDYYKKYQIYITSDEVIKEDDWGLSKLNEVILFGRSYNEKFYKKIILTTDQDLIADGVQAIDDEFLEWFVENPSCEFVEVQKWTNYSEVKYKIIIPQKESKQEGYICPHTKIQCDDECCVSAEDCHITSSLASGMVDCKEPKQETLKDLSYWKANAEEDYMKVPISVLRYITELEERMYSEEEVKRILMKTGNYTKISLDVWFEQFKKK